MTISKDPTLATVPFAATPARQPMSVKDWANHCVWTDPMLAALETGVRGGRWHTLIDKVYSPLNLASASQSVQANQGAAGVDHQSVDDFWENHQEEMRRLEEA